MNEKFEVTLTMGLPLTPEQREQVAERIRIAIRTTDERNLLTPDSYAVFNVEVKPVKEEPDPHA